MITKEQAATLRHGQVIHCGKCRVETGPKGGKTFVIEQWRVSGKMQTWKRNPEAFRVPLKYGLYTFGELSQDTADQFHFADECPIIEAEVKERKAAQTTTPDELTEFSDSREEPFGPGAVVVVGASEEDAQEIAAAVSRMRRWKAVYVSSDEDEDRLDEALVSLKNSIPSLEWDEGCELDDEEE